MKKCSVIWFVSFLVILLIQHIELFHKRPFLGPFLTIGAQTV